MFLLSPRLFRTPTGGARLLPRNVFTWGTRLWPLRLSIALRRRTLRWFKGVAGAKTAYYRKKEEERAQIHR